MKKNLNILITAPFACEISAHSMENAIVVKLRDGYADVDEPDSAIRVVCNREYDSDAINMLGQRGAFAAVFPREPVLAFISRLQNRFGKLWIQDNSGSFQDIADGKFVLQPVSDRVPVDGREFANLRRNAGLTVEQAARMLHMEPEIWMAWEAGTRNGWNTGLTRFKEEIAIWQETKALIAVENGEIRKVARTEDGKWGVWFDPDLPAARREELTEAIQSNSAVICQRLSSQIAATREARRKDAECDVDFSSDGPGL